MRRCYKCGAKKQDDLILCEKCAEELDKKLEEAKKEKHWNNGDKKGDTNEIIN